MKTLRILLGIAIALLLIAIFNFINLETAQAVNKSKEVGLRKSLGVSKISLIGRFMTESMLISLLAAFVSLPLAFYGINLFEEILPEGFAIDWTSPIFWLSLLLLVVIVGFLSGGYPAFVASSFSPARALKSNSRTTSDKGGNQLLRKVLITSQFVFSQLLIICTLGILLQISFVLNKEMGFKEEGILYFRTPHYESADKRQLLVNEIRKMAQIQKLSVIESTPARNGWSTSTMKYYNKDSMETVQSVHQKRGDENYLDLFDIKLMAGRNVRKGSTPTEILINESYVRSLGKEKPEQALGVRVSNGDDVYEVVGVMQDFHSQSLHTEIEPLMFSINKKYARIIAMEVSSSDFEETIGKLTDEWSKVYPERPLEVEFLDKTIENFYKDEKRSSRIAGVSTIIAILISSLGLFGLISYNVVQKSKEVGIRKVLGASLLNIGTILSKEFIFLLLIAFLIAIPISYYAINAWLEGFSYKTEINWWVYGLGGFTSVVIALLSIGSKIWRASDANPIDSLRYE